MKKYLKVVISSILLLAILSMTGCGHIFRGFGQRLPDGYTGGLGISYGSGIEHYWVESYDEVVEAVEKLKSHGSSFANSAIFSYEGELFDTKYCFTFDGNTTENIKFGEDPFDRRGGKVRITSYAFLEEVTIDELVYTSISNYDVVYFYPDMKFKEKIGEGAISDDQLSFELIEGNLGGYVCCDGDFIIHISRKESGEYLPLDNAWIEPIMDSVEFIEAD